MPDRPGPSRASATTLSVRFRATFPNATEFARPRGENRQAVDPGEVAVASDAERRLPAALPQRSRPISTGVGLPPALPGIAAMGRAHGRQRRAALKAATLAGTHAAGMTKRPGRPF